MMLFDPGLQPERTALAWRRTGAAFLVNAALIARFAYSTKLSAAAYALAGAVSLVGFATSMHARPAYARRVAARPAAQRGALRALSAATIATTLGCLALITLALA